LAKEYGKQKPHLAKVLERNITTLLELRCEQDERRSLQDRIADWITQFSGSMLFVYLHAAWFTGWVLINFGWTQSLGLPEFDPFPFGLLTLIVSLEAIFLSTFVLLSQNRQAAVEDERADLDLQIDLLAEHEITRILGTVDAIADHLGVKTKHDHEIDELKEEIKPDLVIRAMQDKKQELGLKPPPGKKKPEGN
jgi:uncharacterized membrane protein